MVLAHSVVLWGDGEGGALSGVAPGHYLDVVSVAVVVHPRVRPGRGC